MNLRELRIGNWVHIPQLSADKRIGYISENGRFATENYEHSFSSIHAAYPIKLTEEWLLRFGFEKHLETSFLKGGINLRFHPDQNSVSLIDSMGPRYNRIKSVHHLQNLYFCLTGKELTNE